MGLRPGDLRCEYRTDPMGIDAAAPRLSWELRSRDRGQRQTAYRIRVASTEALLAAAEPDLWDTGRIPSGATCQIPYGGAELVSGADCFWQVKVWDKAGAESPWSDIATWSMGLLDGADWQGQWIGCGDLEATLEAPLPTILPTPHLRKEFTVEKAVTKARLYVSALGLFECYINGARVGEDYFTPGTYDFRYRTVYLTYDVTSLLSLGDNAFGAILNDGWYSGYNDGPRERNIYGGRPRLIVHLEITFDDETSMTVGTDNTWKAGYGPIVASDLQIGCEYDARLEVPGWDLPGFDDSAWIAANVDETVTLALDAKTNEAVRIFQLLSPIAVTEPTAGHYVVDMGQNMVGWARIAVRGTEGQTVAVMHGEMLNPDGTVYRDNLVDADCIDTYHLAAGGATLEPKFTYRGFRYLEITGLDQAPAADSISGVVVHSPIRRVGRFASSHELLNSWYRNIIWSQRGNHLEIPTDCPQRSERLGWCGDIQAFFPMGAFNYDLGALITKWLVDLDDGQRGQDGGYTGFYPAFAPAVMSGFGWGGLPSTGWSEAGVIVPSLMSDYYADRRILETYYDSMAAFLDAVNGDPPQYLGHDAYTYNDWLHLAAEGYIPFVIAVGYFAHVSHLMARIAETLERADDVAKYDGWFSQIKANFQDAVDIEGHVIDPMYQGEPGPDSSQTAYALALMFDLLPEELRDAAVGHLATNIAGNDNHLNTGFLGTPELLTALHEGGRDDLVYTLLLQETYPSWLYSVLLGATTIWERWDGWTPEEGFQNPDMNSFNHYALGSAGKSLYVHLAGIQGQDAFKMITIKPVIGSGISWVQASYRSIRGLIGSAWHMVDNTLTLEVEIPPNTTGVVHVPTTNVATVREGRRAAALAPNVTYLGANDGYAAYSIGSGKYCFSSEVSS